MVDSKLVTAKIKSEIARKVASIKNDPQRAAELERQLNAAHAAGKTADLIRLLNS
jgi:hypothetical protein